MNRVSLAVASSFALLFGDSAGAQPLYSNGAFVTHPQAHVSGEDVSLAQDVTYPGYTALGFSAGPEWRLADDFGVPTGQIWTIEAITLFAYQTGTEAPFTDARVIVWRGVPDFAPSEKLFDGTASNVLGDSMPGPYRIAQSVQATGPFTDTARRVQALTIELPEPLVLEGGSYWVDWSLLGAQAANPVYTPPVSILGQAYTAVGGFARQKCPTTVVQPDCVPGSWRLFENGSSPNLVDLPFLLIGTSFLDSIFVDGFDTLPDDDDP